MALSSTGIPLRAFDGVLCRAGVGSLQTGSGISNIPHVAAAEGAPVLFENNKNRELALHRYADGIGAAFAPGDRITEQVLRIHQVERIAGLQKRRG